ncbi:MAG: SH3 domain-containing protein [Hyphomicrobiales bacterium]|nr:SH3 domain-containing protein [Hyphomicrobiales bacterium]
MSERRSLTRAAAAIGALAVLLTTGPRGEARACALCGTYTVTGVASWDVLNVRSGPSAHAARIGALPYNGTGVRLDGQCVKSWCTIQFFGVEGWVNTHYLTRQHRKVNVHRP